MKYKLIALVLTVAVIVSLVFVGCAKPAPTPAPAKPLVLKWATHEPDVPASSQELLRRMAALTEEKTEGRVKIEMYWGAVLGKLPDYLKMIGGSGVADGGFVIPTYHQWEIPLSAATGLPYLSTGYRVAPKATWELYNEWPAMQDEWEKLNVKPLFSFQPHAHSACFKQPVTKIDELKGKKLWVAGYWPKTAEQYGMVNVKMTAPDAYDSLQKGLIVGVFGMPFHTFRIFKYFETCKYFVSLEFAGGAPVNFQAINLDVWNQISPGDQKAIEEICAALPDWFNTVQDEEGKTLEEFYKEQGVTLTEFSPEQQAMIVSDCAELTWADWAATAKEKGLPAEEFLERFKAKVAEAQSRS